MPIGHKSSPKLLLVINRFYSVIGLFFGGWGGGNQPWFNITEIKLR